MDLELFKAKTVKILESGADSGTVSALLAELVDMATISAAETIQLQQRLDLSESANSTLRQANMDLFLKIPVTSQPSAEPDPEPDEKPSFDTLFKDGKLL